MNRENCSRDTSGRPEATARKAVSLRTMYAEAMREVMADPRKAIAEYDPWLATLLGAQAASGSGQR